MNILAALKNNRNNNRENNMKNNENIGKNIQEMMALNNTYYNTFFYCLKIEMKTNRKIIVTELSELAQLC